MGFILYFFVFLSLDRVRVVDRIGFGWNGLDNDWVGYYIGPGGVIR